jgi:hypothetical protein
MSNAWQQDPEAGKPNDAPSWMDQGNANSRLGIDPTALASVWLEATDDDSFGGEARGKIANYRERPRVRRPRGFAAWNFELKRKLLSDLRSL